MNCRDDIIEPWTVFPRWLNLPQSLASRRCNVIEKQLCKNGLKARVSRHTCFDVEYYVVEQWDKETYFSSEDIAKALKIPNDWVSLANYTDGVGTYWVKEDELNDKYLDCDGEMLFDANEILIKSVKNHLDNDKLIKGSIDEDCNGIEIHLSMRRKQ